MKKLNKMWLVKSSVDSNFYVVQRKTVRFMKKQIDIKKRNIFAIIKHHNK